MATVRHAFAQAWGKNRDPVIGTEPQHAVALGTAVAAEDIRKGRSVDHLRRLRYPHAVGIATYRKSQNGEERRFRAIVPRHAPLPFQEPFKVVAPSSFARRVKQVADHHRGTIRVPRSLAPARGSSVKWRRPRFVLPVGAGRGHQLVKTLWIPDLPASLSSDDEAIISVDAAADSVLRFRIECLGRVLTWEYDRENVRGAASS